MRRVLLVITLLILPVFALADQGIYRDSHGNTAGTWQNNGNQRTYRDSSGNTEGTSTRDNDRRDYRDQYGNFVGSRDRDR